jgi:sec-independent protein translocase protein TatB
MIDFGFDKLALIGAVALIVIGPQKLPRVARTVGHLIGKAQRYVADVKAEVNRSIELEELQKMKTEFEGAARDMEKSVSNTVHQTTWHDSNSHDSSASRDAHSGQHDGWSPQPRSYKPRHKNWRTRREALPHWYKQHASVRSKVLSGAARVARFRPASSFSGSRSSAGARRPGL